MHAITKGNDLCIARHVDYPDIDLGGVGGAFGFHKERNPGWLSLLDVTAAQDEKCEVQVRSVNTDQNGSSIYGIVKHYVCLAASCPRPVFAPVMMTVRPVKFVLEIGFSKQLAA